MCDLCNEIVFYPDAGGRCTVHIGQNRGVPALLLIEDDDSIRLALRLSLEDEGYEVTEAANGSLGLEVFSQTSPDVVLLDLR
ncbi:MAG: response regulator, partial [Actinomycetes bacterium]